MPTPLDILECGLQLIDSENKWCKIDAVQDKDGKSLIGPNTKINSFKDLESIDGCKYCSYGAFSAANFLLKSSNYEARNAESYLYSALNKISPDGMLSEYTGYIEFNDDPDTTYGDVINLWNVAIQMCKDKEGK